MKEILYLEVPYTKILGVFGKEVHLLTDGYKDEEMEEEISKCILIIPEDVYLEEWKKWLNGKRDYCERFNYYCGVMGYTHPTNLKYIGTQKINEWNEINEEMEIIEVPVYKASEFTENGFEHG